MSDIQALKTQITNEIQAANDLKALDDVRVGVLGKKGKITDLMKTLGQMDAEERKTKGQALNQLKDEIADVLRRRENDLKKSEMAARLATETLDVTLAVRPQSLGKIHPLSQTTEELVAIFGAMG